MNKIVPTSVGVSEVKEVWVIISNTDLTEGKGAKYVLAVCETKATAIREAKGGYVQGSDCPVHRARAYKIRDEWFVPGDIIPPNESDRKLQKQIDEADELIADLRAKGVTDKQIKALAHSDLLKGTVLDAG